ncbi:MAG: hypothetical protein C0497_15670 [Gemmatimonas sp.]|nr:hypothetical protein [Gemmatimonas sp.]
MKHKRFIGGFGVAGLVLLLFGTNYASAHCDALDGPVVKAAQRALQTNNVNLVLIRQTGGWAFRGARLRARPRRYRALTAPVRLNSCAYSTRST